MSNFQHKCTSSLHYLLSCEGHDAQELADEANGDNILIVTHGDGVNASVTRIWPWALSHPVLHTGFTVAARDREEGPCLLPHKYAFFAAC